MEPEDLLLLFISLEPIIRSVLHRISRWRTPANWSRSDWVNEERSVINQSVCQTVIDYRSDSATALSHAVYFHALSRALTRYRQECLFSSRFIPLAPSKQTDETDKPEPNSQNFAISAAFSAENELNPGWLTDALECLSDDDTQLIRKLFWEERTQAQLALELHVSQRTVSERKRRALDNLRIVLRNRVKPIGL
jgi:RNA polymerase sigma factor (sigma-70 family)